MSPDRNHRILAPAPRFDPAVFDPSCLFDTQDNDESLGLDGDHACFGLDKNAFANGHERFQEEMIINDLGIQLPASHGLYESRAHKHMARSFEQPEDPSSYDYHNGNDRDPHPSRNQWPYSRPDYDAPGMENPKLNPDALLSPQSPQHHAFNYDSAYSPYVSPQLQQGEQNLPSPPISGFGHSFLQPGAFLMPPSSNSGNEYLSFESDYSPVQPFEDQFSSAPSLQHGQELFPSAISPPYSPQTDVDGDETSSYHESSIPERNFQKFLISTPKLTHQKSGRPVFQSNSGRQCHVPPETMASLIDGPNEGKYRFTCLYNDCGKKFSRKYNIQSHIQTHLCDRPFRCPECKAGFVRRHDLRRHSRIHGGMEAKSWVCDCGKAFGRCDALTRHRQRGICVGSTVERKKPSAPDSKKSSTTHSDESNTDGSDYVSSPPSD